MGVQSLAPPKLQVLARIVRMVRMVGILPASVLLLLLVPVSQARPQTVHEVSPADRARVLAEFIPAPDCDSIFRRSLPECQQAATVYRGQGQVWGELTVDVSSPVLFITKPKDLIQKRKEKEKEKKDGLSV